MDRIARGRIAAAHVVVASLLVACGGVAAPASLGPSALPSGEPQAESASPSQRVVSGKVDVGGHSLYYACFGEGSPTVILEHGLGGDMGEWGAVLPAISAKTMVCGYDRANARGSDSVDATRTVADSVADLHALLTKTGVPGPYVFVGFSWGGLVDQLYARTYPADVAGLVLIDSNNADEAETYWAHLSPAQVAVDKEETGGPNPEHVDILRSFEIVRAAPNMPDVPLVVVTHTVADPTEWPAGWDPKTFEALQAGLQAELVKLTSKGSQVLAPGAGHDIPNENPGAVSAAILQVVAAAGGN